MEQSLKFKVSLGYILRPHLKTTKIEMQKTSDSETQELGAQLSGRILA